VNGGLIGETEVLEFIAWARDHVGGAAFFDLSFVLGMLHFQRHGVTSAVVEAGVGGAGDASNALERVSLTVLTNVDYDHEAVIGVGPEDSVLKNIALEKAGAIRPRTPVVTAARGEALEVIRRVAREREAPLYELGATESLMESLFALPHPPRMRGAHQLENARLTVAALRLLGRDETAVRAALEATWAGRLEVFRCDDQEVWMDGAHNPAGAHALSVSLNGRFTLVFGAMQRKNVAGLLEPLLEKANAVHFVSPGALGASPDALAAQFGGTSHASLTTALTAALETRDRVLVAGSLYLVGAARAWLLERGFELEPSKEKIPPAQ
jgi:dihydrofolate synthase/folylpolyglutamate synthase